MSDIECHRKLLGDHRRNQAFYTALKKVIIPGITDMVDLGSGTGFLSILARKLGARKCLLIENSPICKLSKDLAELNGINGCEFVQAHSSQLKKKGAYNLLVTETLGAFALEENIIENVESVRKLLTKNATIMPRTLTQYIAPVKAPRCHDEVNVWDGLGYGLDFSPAKVIAVNNMYVKTLQSSELAFGHEGAVKWDFINFSERNSSQRQGEASWVFDDQEKIYGFCLWWECELAEGVLLSTSPFLEPTHWEQVYLPVFEPLAMNSGDELSIKISSDTRYQVGVRVKWDVSVRIKGSKRAKSQTYDLNKGWI